MKTSILLYLHKWNFEKTRFYISEDLYFENIKEKPIAKLYKKLCNTLKIDDAEPFEIDSHIVVKENLFDEDFIFWHTPQSIISKICNILALCSNIPISYYRIIMSEDSFNTNIMFPIEIFYEYELLEVLTISLEFKPQIEEILNKINRTFIEKNKLTNEFLSQFKKCYENYNLISRNKRIKNAFDFFFNSWHSHQMEQVCVNLAILLESLFAPGNSQELSHQISFNFSHFIGSNSIERENIYRLNKKFYQLRSQIVHGSDPKLNDLYVLTPVMFVLCIEVLRKLLLDIEIAHDFSTEQERQKLFKKYMFE